MSRLLRQARHRLRSLFRPGTVDDELQRELALHVAMLEREQRADGASDADARRAARLAFGPPDRVREECRDTRRVTLAEDFTRDVRYAFRTMRRAPGFALVAISSLALGIGANLAIFSLVDSVVLRTLPVERPGELVFLKVAGSAHTGGAPPYPCFERIRAEVRPLTGLAAFATDEQRAEVDGVIEQVFGQVASDNYFSTLGVAPAAGRVFRDGDERLQPPIAVISHAYWHRRFGGDPSALGRVITLGETAFVIVGVTPPGFHGLEPGRRVDVTVPITQARALLTDAGAWWFSAVGRLRPGAVLDQAAAHADTVFQSFMRDRPWSSEIRERYFRRVVLTPASRGLEGLRTQFSTPLALMSAIGVVVLLVACANLGSLLVARGEARAREMAIRMATGAGTGRLVRQLLTETLLLFVLGAAGGIAIAHLIRQAAVAFFAAGRRPIYLELHDDWRLAIVAMGLTLIAALLTGLLPAVRALGADPHQAMKDRVGGLAGSRRASLASRGLIAGQMALSVVLLVAALLFGQTMASLRAVDLGFGRSRVLTMSLDLVMAATAAAKDRPAFHRDVLERVRRLTGIEAVSLSSLTPLSGRDTSTFVTVRGFAPASETDGIVHVNQVSEDYFRTFGVAIVAGRAFAPGDTTGAPRVAVVNQAASRMYFGGRSPIGETIVLKSTAYTVVGIAGDYKHLSVREPSPRFVFVPTGQAFEPIGRMTLSVASGLPETELTRAVSVAVRAAHPRAIVSDVITVERQIDATLIGERLLARLAGGFALVAVMLAIVGLYGTLSYSVARRRAELGLRMALGARQSQVAGGVVRQMLSPVAAGTAAGLALSVVVARQAEPMLFGVTASDMPTYGAAVAVLALVTVVAAWLPARQAASIDPVKAIRAD